MQTSRTPWYGFLYRILGAHGTFWLWVVAAIAMWWTWHGAFIRILDRDPDPRSVADVAASSDLHRWVQLHGVELLLDGALLSGKEGGTDLQPVRILMDEHDPAATFWLTVKSLADTKAFLRSPKFFQAVASLGDTGLALFPAGEQIVRATPTARFRGELQNIDDLQHLLVMDRRSFLPRAPGALLLLSDEDGAATMPGASIGSLTGTGQPVVVSSGTTGAATAGATTAGGPASSRPSASGLGDDPLKSFESSTDTWGDDVVRTHVRLTSTTGLLDRTPPALVERLETDPGVHLLPSALRVNRKPRDLELYVFCTGALVVVFLAAGLYGAGGKPRADKDSGTT